MIADELADQKRQTQHWQELAQQKLAEIEGLAANQREVEQTMAADRRQETDHFRQEIAELIEEHALVKREQAIQAAELQAAREQNVALEEELANQARQAQRWKEMLDCAKQVTNLRTLFEHRQACQEANEKGAARASDSADLGRRLDRQEDSSMLQPTYSDQVAWQAPPMNGASNRPASGPAAANASEKSSEKGCLTAKHRAQWEELLRTRLRAPM